MQLQQNSLFDNRYMLRTLIGRGGFSEVWLAHDTWTDLDIAIKVYAPGQGMDTNGLQIFSKELACVFNLNHPNLLKPTHVGQWLNMPYLIMEYCPKGALNKQVGKLTEQEIWKVLHDVAAGLAYLHSKEIVHQDIKPDNILRDENGDYRITDFGISTKARTTLRRSVGGASVSGGTTAYMAPERFSANPAPTKASDVWSLGAMIYELITGDVPFGEIGGGLQKNGAEIPEIKAQVSDALKRTICQMLAPNAWDRPTAETIANGEKVSVNNNSTDSRKSRSFSFSDFLDILGGLFCFLIPFIGLILSIVFALYCLYQQIYWPVRYGYPIYPVDCIPYIISFGGLLLFLGGKYLWAKEGCLEGAKCWFNWCYKWADSRWGSIFIGGWSLILIALMITPLVYYIYCVMTSGYY